MKVGGTCSFFFHLHDKADLSEISLFAKEKGLPLFVLGGGSNILFPDDHFNKVVVRIENKEMIFKDEGENVRVEVGAGESWDDFVSQTVAKGLSGVENLSAIPGTVGASPVQNIGAYGVEAKDTILSVEVFDKNSLEFKVLTNEECEFGYRDSIFKKEKGKDYIVTSVTFLLSKTNTPKISYKDLKIFFGENQNPSVSDVRDAVIKIRAGKFPDLNVYGTAGSFFKNIILRDKDAENLVSIYPEVPIYDAGVGLKKISTAWILDKVCGLKGYRDGEVGLYDNQPLVLVNYSNAKSDEIKVFIDYIKRMVEEKTGLQIEEEVILA